MLSFVIVLAFVRTCLSYNKQISLSGQHFNFTLIHEPPYVDVGASDGMILDKAQWKGYIPDMIAVIATKAGFTYELFLPSGNGPSCSGTSQLAWSMQYKCKHISYVYKTYLSYVYSYVKLFCFFHQRRRTGRYTYFKQDRGLLESILCYSVKRKRWYIIHNAFHDRCWFGHSYHPRRGDRA